MESGERVHEHARLGDEHSRVPQVSSRGEVLGGRSLVGLFDEAGDGARRAEALSRFNVPVGGRWAVGGNPYCDDVALLGGFRGAQNRPPEGLLVCNEMVGGEGADHGFGVAGLDDGRGQANRAHRSPRRRLDDERRAGHERGDGVGVGGARDDRDVVGYRREPVHGGLEHAFPGSCEVGQEFRRAAAGERPQARAGSACGDDGVEGHGFSVPPSSSAGLWSGFRQSGRRPDPASAEATPSASAGMTLPESGLCSQSRVWGAERVT